ncbi:hypothetical protein AGMMS49965_03140 [Bacteroidia bacterium]|nr:hypothetical protein AGMMS49965_03140 [Bacteroidia bacterium]
MIYVYFSIQAYYYFLKYRRKVTNNYLISNAPQGKRILIYVKQNSNRAITTPFGVKFEGSSGNCEEIYNCPVR